MVELGVDTVDLPYSTAQRTELVEEKLDATVQDANGEFFSFPFKPDEQNERAGKQKPRVASVEELRLSFVTWLQKNKPSLLHCAVELLLKSNNHRILWTPAYCPDLQPAELFWAAGKNNIAGLLIGGQKIKDAAMHLREGWYGTRGNHPPSDTRYHVETNCRKLVKTLMDFGNNKFVPMCDGISGVLGSLVIDPKYEPDLTGIPIDTLLNIVSKFGDGDDFVEVEI